MKQPLLCTTVSGATMEALRSARDAAEGADVVELRLDGVDRPDPAAAIAGRTRPVIVTCRPQWEGGWFRGSEDERQRLLEAAATSGAEFIDVEASASFAGDLIRSRGGRGTVLSMHTFGPAPSDIADRYQALKSRGAEVVKLAVEVSALSDTLPLFELGAAAGRETGEPGHVLVAMGPAGVPTRICAARLGNRWTYAGAGIAPGQIAPARLLREFRFRRVQPDAALYGVAGNPIYGSLSPAMHNAGFAALGLNAVYVPLQAREVEDFVRFARAMGLRGASITAPFKVALLEHVDHVEPLARRVGAINTLVVREGRWIGANTDVDGFLAALVNIRSKGLRASVLGAGGAARAVSVALADRGAAVTICARRPDAARPIADLVGGTVGAFPPRSGSWDLLVNATTAGSSVDPQNPIAGAPLDGEIVYDLVYAPAETELLADARREGCLTIGGLAMLVAQAERQFELWTGQRPPAGLFQAAAAPAGAGAGDFVRTP
ncbi:MAG TPA: type I 3-dehydroquinate dehydratase [Vicinamibacterales bacterium]|nr:type I 3-dehydroquinate dehydratase [Vicinamibacterales bacterium]